MAAWVRRTLRLALCGLLLSATTACRGVEALEDEAASISVVTLSQGVRLDPDQKTDVVVQAQNGDGNGVDGVRVFFLVGDGAVISFADHPGTDLLYDRTSAQEASGFKAAGLAKVTIVADEKAGGKSTKLVVGLSSPSDETPEDGVGFVVVTVDAPATDADGGS